LISPGLWFNPGVRTVPRGTQLKTTKETTLEMRVLGRCVKAMGSARAVAHALRVPMLDLQLWLQGTERPPRSYLLAAIDLLVERHDVGGLTELHSLVPGHIDPTRASGATDDSGDGKP
jgi:hypothetical protein